MRKHVVHHFSFYKLDLIKRELAAGIIATSACLALVAVRVAALDSTQYLFLPWNIFLAWVGWGFGVAAFAHRHTTRPVYVTTLLGLGWLLFLPNTFYLLTDFIHPVLNYDRVPNFYGGDFAALSNGPMILLDISILALAAYTGWLLGITGLRIVYKRLLRSVSRLKASLVVNILVAAAAYGVYLGRSPRLNSWDALARPHIFLRDSFNILTDSTSLTEAYILSTVFFVMISAVFWSIELISPTKPPKAK